MRRAQKFWPLLLVCVIVAALIYLWMQAPVLEWIDTLRLWILSLGWVGVVAFVVLYIVITIVLGPATALTLLAGLAYGAWGFVLVVFSATLAAAVAFLIGRYLAYERVNLWIEGKPKLLALNRAVSEEGWRVVALMRLSPVLPYGLQNYLFSVTHVGFMPFAIATLLGIMPATALYVYIGSLGQAIGRASTLQWVLGAVGLAATALVALVVGRRAKQALDKQAAG